LNNTTPLLQKSTNSFRLYRSVYTIAQEKEFQESGSPKTYYILFQPNEDIMNNGTNPLFLIDELYSIGQCICIPITHKIPAIEDFDPNKCYTTWEIFLATESDINAITDVFIFVEDECVLEVNQLSEYNLLANPMFAQKVEDIRTLQREMGLAQLKSSLVHSLSRKPKLSTKAKDEKVGPIAKDSTISSIRVSSDKLDQLMNLVSELVTTQARLALYIPNRMAHLSSLPYRKTYKNSPVSSETMRFSIVLNPDRKHAYPLPTPGKRLIQRT
jgi:two-component system chemotaxis sensor kinase CheA